MGRVLFNNFFSHFQHDARRAIFAENLEFINRHNAEYEAGLHTFIVGVNEFADMTNAEFVQQFNGLKMSSSKNQHQHRDNGVVTPAEVDWRTKVKT